MTEKTCGDCIYGRGEECDGPGGSREGHEIYSDTPACDCYEEDAPTPEIFPGTLDALHKLGVANVDFTGAGTASGGKKGSASAGQDKGD